MSERGSCDYSCLLSRAAYWTNCNRCSPRPGNVRRGIRTISTTFPISRVSSIGSNSAKAATTGILCTFCRPCVQSGHIKRPGPRCVPRRSAVHLHPDPDPSAAASRSGRRDYLKPHGRFRLKIRSLPFDGRASMGPTAQLDSAPGVSWARDCCESRCQVTGAGSM